MNVPLANTFINQDGFKLTWLRNEKWGFLRWSKSIWMFELDEEFPLMWYDGKYYWQPNKNEAETDLGSIPPPLRGILPHDEFPRSFCIHDSACKKGGLWRSETGEAGTFVFTLLTMRVANLMLKDMIKAEGGRFKQYLIMVGVFFWRLWVLGTGMFKKRAMKVTAPLSELSRGCQASSGMICALQLPLRCRA